MKEIEHEFAPTFTPAPLSSCLPPLPHAPLLSLSSPLLLPPLPSPPPFLSSPSPSLFFCFPSSFFFFFFHLPLYFTSSPPLFFLSYCLSIQFRSPVPPY